MDRAEGRWLDAESEAGREPDGAEQAELVFGKAPFRLTNGPDHAFTNILLAVHEIQHYAGIVPHEQAIDGEVAALNVFLWVLGVLHLIGMTAIGVAPVGPKGCHFHLEAVSRDEHYAKLRTDSNGIRKELHHALRAGIGRDVVV